MLGSVLPYDFSKLLSNRIVIRDNINALQVNCLEIDELEKRIDWLDSERQKDKKQIAELTDKLESIREEYSKVDGRIIALDLEIKTIKKN